MSKNEDYINQFVDVERRFTPNPVTIQKRAEGDDENEVTIVTGYAAKFNKRTKIGSWFEEEILPGAFDDVLLDDVRCLKNHDANLVLARSNNGKGTLKLEVDEIGLKYTFSIPNRSVGRDLEDEIATGDISQSSFAFTAEEVIWIDREDEVSIRQIKKVGQLYDVSPVTYPAYQDTSIGKRAFDAHIANIEVKNPTQVDKNKRAFDVFDAQFQFNKIKK